MKSEIEPEFMASDGPKKGLRLGAGVDKFISDFFQCGEQMG